MEIQKIEYRKNEKNFLDKIKIKFRSFGRLSFGGKIKKQRTQALKCFSLFSKSDYFFLDPRQIFWKAKIKTKLQK